MSDEQAYWLVFASLVGWTRHPGYVGRGVSPPSGLELAELAAVLTHLGQQEFKKWQDGLQPAHQ